MSALPAPDSSDPDSSAPDSSEADPLDPATSHPSERIRRGGGWEGRYQADDAPWDLGAAPPHLDDLVASLALRPLDVLIPGGGRGHDAVPWARAGHRVTVLDVAPTAIAQGRVVLAAHGVEVECVVGDLFDLPAGLVNAFDVVWEQTCFCAIDPAQRVAYVEAMAAALRPCGRLHGVLWEHGKEGGPPWSITPTVVQQALETCFDVERLERIPDWGKRRWNEFVVSARRRC